jgi:hypothetical protein
VVQPVGSAQRLRDAFGKRAFVHVGLVTPSSGHTNLATSPRWRLPLPFAAGVARV